MAELANSVRLVARIKCFIVLILLNHCGMATLAGIACFSPAQEGCVSCIHPDKRCRALARSQSGGGQYNFSRTFGDFQPLTSTVDSCTSTAFQNGTIFGYLACARWQGRAHWIPLGDSTMFNDDVLAWMEEFEERGGVAAEIEALRYERPTT